MKKQARAIDAMGIAKDDIVVTFPILRSLSDSSAHDLTLFKFVPFKVSPGPMLLTNTKSIKMHSGRDFTFLLPMWVNPVFYLILAMAASSGVIFWVTEFRDSGEKPNYSFRSFIREMGNSIWFSIVTMTTVGYGDIVPRYLLARIYAIIWMLTGIVLVSLFTAYTSSAMTTHYMNENKSLFGKKIGVFRSTRIFFQNEINFGAKMTEYNEREAFRALNEGNISRILFPDFMEAMYLLSKTDKKFTKGLRIVDCINHPFKLGIYIAATNELNNAFLTCLAMTLNWYYLEESQNDFSKIEDSDIENYSLDNVLDDFMVNLTIYVLFFSGSILLLSVIVWVARPKLHRRLSRSYADKNNA
ncbi:uncharacterized protein LOC114527320 [Dendronephthya gigantea]|uniref:uncharacterized protein LOC114527320 n=1 Tax=Dendronephthya gigantea TaxID=151771 RepID=UPI00106C30D4|nr:uncharacterized protein LOC114527320 [Dendronephthya gigantea]